MKLNEEKCHFMFYGDKSDDHNVNVGLALIKESTEEKLHGVSLDKDSLLKSIPSSLVLRLTNNYTGLQ